ncbi:MAG: hypothetical protein AB1649_03725 [Chloroflexota bacterium]
MNTEQDKERNAISQTTGSVALGAIVAFGYAVFEAYTMYSEIGIGDSAKALASTVSVLGSVMLLITTWFLKTGSRKALYFWLIGLGLGLSRWLFIDQSFAVTIPAILLLALFGYLTWKLVRWVRMGALT